MSWPDYGLDGPVSKSLQGCGKFLFSTISRQPLEPTTLPIQWVMELSAGCNAAGAPSWPLTVFERNVIAWRVLRVFDLVILKRMLKKNLETEDFCRPSQDRDGWQAHVKDVMNFRVPQNAENFLTSWVTYIFWIRTLYDRISWLFGSLDIWTPDIFLNKIDALHYVSTECVPLKMAATEKWHLVALLKLITLRLAPMLSAFPANTIFNPIPIVLFLYIHTPFLLGFEIKPQLKIYHPFLGTVRWRGLKFAVRHSISSHVIGRSACICAVV